MPPTNLWFIGTYFILSKRTLLIDSLSSTLLNLKQCTQYPSWRRKISINLQVWHRGAYGIIFRLNTRRAVRGRGTDRQGNTSNHTNMFHLGTRLPSLGPSDLEHWDKVILRGLFPMKVADTLGRWILLSPSKSDMLQMLWNTRPRVSSLAMAEGNDIARIERVKLKDL